MNKISKSLLPAEKRSTLLLSLFSILIFLFAFSSCVKDEFDAPPADGVDPDITANATISELKQLFTGTPLRIPVDIVIKGVVISDDKTGNFYKTLVIQDSTAGISIRIEQTDLYAEYPVGRRVFVKCKNLWLGDYGNLVQLGGSLDESDPQNLGVGTIPSSLIGNYILKGQYNIAVEPLKLTIDILDNLYQNMLIQLSDVEFINSELGATYADAENQLSENRTIGDCDGNRVLLRTSGFAAFAGDTLPEGNGTVTAILSVFSSDFQLIVNDTRAVQLDSGRCSGSGGGGILDIRNLYSGADVTIGSGILVAGIVISDKDNGNFDPKNLVVQDSFGGIVIRFALSHTFSLGDDVIADVSGLTLTEYNGLIEIMDAPNSIAFKIGTGSITPRNATISQIISNANWESTLVKIADATMSGGGGLYSGTNSLTDATGAIDIYTRSGASFATTSYPTGSITITAVVGDFNGAQLSIRNTTDVQ